MTALLVSFGSSSEPCLSFSAFVGGPVAGLVVDASFGDFIRRAPRALPSRPRQGIGCLRHLFQRDLPIFPPEVAGWVALGDCSPKAPTDPYVRHSRIRVLKSRSSLRDGTPNGPPPPQAEGTVPAGVQNGLSAKLADSCGQPTAGLRNTNFKPRQGGDLPPCDRFPSTGKGFGPRNRTVASCKLLWSASFHQRKWRRATIPISPSGNKGVADAPPPSTLSRFMHW